MDSVITFFSDNLSRAALLIVIGVLAALVKLFLLKRAPNGWFIFVPGIIAMLVLPPLPELVFSMQTKASLKNQSIYEVVEKTRYFDYFEPLTWVHNITNTFGIARPRGPLSTGQGYDKNRGTNSFELSVLGFGATPSGSHIDADCDERTMFVSTSDDQGMMRMLGDRSMDDQMFDILCAADYSENYEAMLAKGVYR